MYSPVTILEEILSKPPNYVIINKTGVKKSNEIRMAIVYEEEAALGYGYSKQCAKRDAAANLLKKLNEEAYNAWRIEADKMEIIEKPQPLLRSFQIIHRRETNENNVNEITVLCKRIGMGPPKYIEFVGGPSHHRIHAVTCEMSGQIQYQAYASSKKLGRQKAAGGLIKLLRTIDGLNKFGLDNEIAPHPNKTHAMLCAQFKNIHLMMDSFLPKDRNSLSFKLNQGYTDIRNLFKFLREEFYIRCSFGEEKDFQSKNKVKKVIFLHVHTIPELVYMGIGDELNQAQERACKKLRNSWNKLLL